MNEATTQEVSVGSDPALVISHTRPPIAAPEATLSLVSRHVQQHIGHISNILNDAPDSPIPIDLIVVNPVRERPFYTIITSGMSRQPMPAPPQAADHRFAELIMCLPSTWRMTPEEQRREEHAWPLHWLRRIASLPHEQDTWIWEGHTIPNGDPPIPFAGNTRMSSMMLIRPQTTSKEFWTLHHEGKTIHFFALLPLSGSEYAFQKKKGPDALMKLILARKVTALLDVSRKSVTEKPWWRFV
ncbi:suppressor of fused domain protein [Geminisphaera colitermitum]|uniref:suppressor of fused domain protein n=1 Tax=Geminisphaera colitermitum TaxID=1148786 RepID=UPI000158E2AF|nr:suppressor of fused domain protein [Geminisphaera colitermitum]